MKSWLLAILLSLAAIVPMIYLVYNATRTNNVTEGRSAQTDPQFPTVEFKPRVVPPLEVGSVLEVKACKVIDGYRFAMYLEGDRWIEAHLPVATKDEAAPVVVSLLKELTTAPTVKLRRKAGNFWIVDFTLMVSGEKKSLSDVLKAKSLLLE